jgi:hypothetical protein
MQATNRTMNIAAGHLQAPYMLDDIVANAQRLSTRLPPDEWDPEALFFGLRRDTTGAFDLVRVPRKHYQLHRLTHNVLESSSPTRTAVGEIEKRGEGCLGWLERILKTIREGLRGRRKIS